MLTGAEKEIVETRRIIADKRHWTQGTFAKDRAGQTVCFDGGTAHKFCAFGALQRAAWELGCDLQGDKSCIRIAKKIGDKLAPVSNLANINDGTDGHAMVLAIFDKALEE
jgi:hypothetical protein